MSKNLAAALFALAGGVGYFAGAAGGSTGAQPVVKLVNAKFVKGRQRVSLSDGGSETQESWLVRSCGYLMVADGGQEHVAEPCWDSFISAADFAPIERQLLTGDAGL